MSKSKTSHIPNFVARRDGLYCLECDHLDKYWNFLPQHAHFPPGPAIWTGKSSKNIWGWEWNGKPVERR